MTKSSKSTSAERTLRKGGYEISGTDTGRIAEINAGRALGIGIAADGTVIMAPKMKPRNFTVHQIREAIRAVKEEERRKQTSGNVQQPSR